LALADFLPCGRPAPLRGPPWVVGFFIFLQARREQICLKTRCDSRKFF
jgi:hypothetical protein